MNDNDRLASDCQPTASGILLCLRMLVDEAGTLKLKQSVQVLRAAMAAIEAEAKGAAGIAPVSRPLAVVAVNQSH
jgi:hypothetical protein